MTERRLPKTAVENLVEDLASKANADLSNLDATGQAKFDAKANVANTVTTDTAQTISGAKTFIGKTIVNGGAGNGTFTIKNDVTDYGTSAVDLVVATSNGKNQFLVHFQEGNQWCAWFEQHPSTKNVSFILSSCEKVIVPTPATTANDAQAATTEWVNVKAGGFANTNASNFTEAGKQTIVGWGMPDYSAAVSMTSGSSAPKNGWAIAHGLNASVVYSVNGVSVAQGDWYSGQWSGNWNLQIMVSAGDVVTGGGWKFIPCKGVN